MHARLMAGYKTGREAALAQGVALSTYAQHELAEQFLPARRAHKYAAFFGVSPEWLLYGRNGLDGEAMTTVPLIGSDGKAVREVHGLPTSTAYTQAYEIKAEDGLGPHFQGWLAFFELVDVENDPHLVGPLSVVALRYPDDTVIRVGRLRSLERGCFHILRDFGDPDFNVQLEWSARITALTPP